MVFSEVFILIRDEYSMLISQVCLMEKVQKPTLVTIQ